MKFVERDFPIGVVEPFVERLVSSGRTDPAGLMTSPGWRPAASEWISCGPPTTRLRRHRRTDAPGYPAVDPLQLPDPAGLARDARYAFNMHPGALPRLAGLFPHFYAMLQGDPAFIVTVHRMVPELDAGSIVMVREVPIDPATSAHMANIDLHRIGAAMMAELVRRIDRRKTFEEW